MRKQSTHTHLESSSIMKITEEKNYPKNTETQEAARPIFCTLDCSLLHRLIHDAYGMIPNEHETINIMHCDPKWQSAICTKIALNKKAAAEEEEDNKDEIQVYSDGSLIDGGIGAAAVMFRRGREEEILHKYLGKADKHTVYEAELVGIIFALQLIQNILVYRSASIALDNTAAIQATKLMTSTPVSYLVGKIHKII